MFENIKIRLKTFQFFKKIFVTEKYKKFKKKIIYENVSQIYLNNFYVMHYHYY